MEVQSEAGRAACLTSVGDPWLYHSDSDNVR